MEIGQNAMLGMNPYHFLIVSILKTRSHFESTIELRLWIDYISTPCRLLFLFLTNYDSTLKYTSSNTLPTP